MAINSYILYLELTDKEKAMYEIELVKVITRNIPKSWKTRFKLANDHKMSTVTGVLKIL